MREFYFAAGPWYVTSYRVPLIQKTDSKFHQYAVLWWSGGCGGDGDDNDDDDNNNDNSFLVY